MWQHFRDYVDDHLFTTWAFGVVLCGACCAGLYSVAHEPKNQGLLLMSISSALALPTVGLLARCSDARRRDCPIPPRQETAIGVFSLAVAGCSIVALALAALDRRAGFSLSPDAELLLLMVFGATALLAPALGYAARYTRTGHLGVVISTVWFAVVLLGGLFAVARS